MNGKEQALFVFDAFMAVLYLAVGLTLLLADMSRFRIQGVLKILLGVLFTVYGLFRIYRAFKNAVSNE
jgi:hypothetical protein